MKEIPAMPRSALSIVNPAVDDIAGRKRGEIRSWAPPAMPLRDLVLVQNTIFLRQDEQEDPDGIALAMVDIVGGTTGRPMKPARKASNGVPDTCAGNRRTFGRSRRLFRASRSAAFMRCRMISERYPDDFACIRGEPNALSTQEGAVETKSRPERARRPR
ncbi:ASCH domain-containing protein [Burkholderia cepacia]|uniref:ASCH domain-containing protein n=1 Tax=Burkholderia cepacia TaxID=292 RepID=UPI0021AB40DD|nr:ASCH domain-containing protein [Burkholderia cepacia]